MPNLTPGDLHVNVPLTQIMVAYQQQTAAFVADQVFPNVPVQFQSDFYYIFGRKSFLQSQAQKRAPSTETPGVEWVMKKETFFCDTWGLHHDIEDQLRANADSNWQLDRTGTELITQQMLLRREKEWMNAFFKTGVWNTDLTGVAAAPAANQFIQFDQAGSSPMTVFRNLILNFRLRTGVTPNVAVFGPTAWNALIDHAEIVDRVKYTQAGFLTEDIVARAIGINRIIVAEAVEATDQEEELVAVQAPTTQFLANDSILVAYAAPNASRNIPSAGYTFSWNGYLGASAYGGRIKKFRMEPIASDRIEIEAAFSMKVVAPELGTFLTDVVST